MGNLLTKEKSNEEKEKTVLNKANTFISHNDYHGLYNLVSSLQHSEWPDLSTARYTKIIRNIFENIEIKPESSQGILEFIKQLISKESRDLIKLDLKCKLVHVFLMTGLYKECLDLIKELIPLLKKYDSRINLIKIYLYESKANYELCNFPHAKSSLTAARALAVSSATSQSLQAEIDLLNGMYLTDEKCYETAINYFLEVLTNSKDINGLRYIILCKILSDSINDINGYLEKISRKIKFDFSSDLVVKLLLDVCKAVMERDVDKYRKILNKNDSVLDLFLIKHLQNNYDNLLEKNILKIIEPYSNIKIQFISEQLGFDQDFVEEKLRFMILNNTINGILDHSTQCLCVFSFNGSCFDETGKIHSILKGFLEKI